MTTTQQLILDRIAAEAAKRTDVVLIDDRRYANVGTLRTYDATTLDHIAAVNYEFNPGRCYFGPATGDRIAAYWYGQPVLPTHASWVKGSISELVAAVIKHLLQSPSGDDWYCDECGALLDEDARNVPGSEHSPACSLYQPEFSPAVEAFLDGVMPTITTEGNTQ